jgi:copper chaperone CopZ
MRTIITSVIFIGLLVLPLFGCEEKIERAKTKTVKIYGNCGMCKETIEEAAFKKKEAKAEWNIDSKMAIITFDSTKTNLEAILKRIARAGYDSDENTAPNSSYEKLHECCKYERKSK